MNKIDSTTLYYGSLVTPVAGSLESYKALPKAALCVSNDTGIIQWIEEDVHASGLQDVMLKHGILAEDASIVELKPGEFLLPGFIDTHTHAPQVPNIGSGQEDELLNWLAKTTFPTEAKFADVAFARKAYASAVRRIIDNGTTTCCYYGTLHLEGTKVLADIVHQYGQRGFVGKCNMDRNSPEYYVEPSAKESLLRTEELITYIRSLPSGSHATTPNALVQPVLTPRFAISCTSDLLTSLGELAASDPSLTIQTHISENASEIAFTKSLFPPTSLPGQTSETTYAGVYDAFGLLRSNTILAHAVHLEDSEVELIKERNAGISHCPTSNFNLRSGWAKVGVLLDKGIKVGLGTDVSGGFSPSILTAVQHASIASKVVALSAPPSASTHPSSQEQTQAHTSTSTPPFANRQLPIATLLYLATLGGAEVCNLAHRVGSLEVGKEFDALVASVRDDAGNPNLWGIDLEDNVKGDVGREELQGMVERFLFCGDDRNIRRVYVRGKLIGGKVWNAGGRV
ncbi:Metallo-dependent hydrolase [Cristinia sonorae]|uniref:Probable guanine deaminase n=1 Tax=Cristinia sonorae TaxID=1940300 RepID=A0A8K0UXX6_9AGAR|nr:Metallo-dependent hydrolase [Cristinia sonorae]